MKLINIEEKSKNFLKKENNIPAPGRRGAKINAVSRRLKSQTHFA